MYFHSITAIYELDINICSKIVYKIFIIFLAKSTFFYPGIHIRFTQNCYYITVEGNRKPEDNSRYDKT